MSQGEKKPGRFLNPATATTCAQSRGEGGGKPAGGGRGGGPLSCLSFSLREAFCENLLNLVRMGQRLPGLGNQAQMPTRSLITPAQSIEGRPIRCFDLIGMKRSLRPPVRVQVNLRVNLLTLPAPLWVLPTAQAGCRPWGGVGSSFQPNTH